MQSLALDFVIVILVVVLAVGLLLPTFTKYDYAFAQHDANASQTTGSPSTVQLKVCKDLGIAPEKCSENEILRARHITTCCPSGVSDPNVASYPKLDIVVISILLGSGVAFAASIFAIKKMMTIKKKKESTGVNNDN